MGVHLNPNAEILFPKTQPKLRQPAVFNFETTGMGGVSRVSYLA
jgi:hypothetical protein